MICFQDADAATTESFEWLSQLRFDFNPTSKDPTEGLTVRMADAQFQYGFEYLGIGERLVQTPLTDRYVRHQHCKGIEVTTVKVSRLTLLRYQG